MYMQVYHSEVPTYSVLQFSLQHKIFVRSLTNVNGASQQPWLSQFHCLIYVKTAPWIPKKCSKQVEPILCPS